MPWTKRLQWLWSSLILLLKGAIGKYLIGEILSKMFPVALCWFLVSIYFFWWRFMDYMLLYFWIGHDPTLKAKTKYRPPQLRPGHMGSYSQLFFIVKKLFLHFFPDRNSETREAFKNGTSVCFFRNILFWWQKWEKLPVWLGSFILLIPNI